LFKCRPCCAHNTGGHSASVELLTSSKSLQPHSMRFRVSLGGADERSPDPLVNPRIPKIGLCRTRTRGRNLSKCVMALGRRLEVDGPRWQQETPRRVQSETVISGIGVSLSRCSTQPPHSWLCRRTGRDAFCTMATRLRFPTDGSCRRPTSVGGISFRRRALRPSRSQSRVPVRPRFRPTMLRSPSLFRKPRLPAARMRRPCRSGSRRSTRNPYRRRLPACASTATATR